MYNYKVPLGRVEGGQADLNRSITDPGRQRPPRSGGWHRCEWECTRQKGRARPSLENLILEFLPLELEK